MDVPVGYIIGIFFLNCIVSLLALMETPPAIRRAVIVPILIGAISAAIVALFYANLELMRPYGTSLFRVVLFLDELSELLFTLVGFYLLGINILKRLFVRGKRVFVWIRLRFTWRG